ncbi:transcriptional regulator with XRE-family HTH domain [Nonomuraea muscovyensis]|uniref:Transcriptional regulator with XRE-family HTH domain n=1 Tax=Nonomuraea muscovyensis TaxID=1124761 RepID=A0A7X0EYC0_9ACTN|nr:helix-turn-helix domain-containing protein [Nonomuraea muscovyensis]MBB6345516.1 transcriptional regulator with XRE-family HTH domain [Nonomuraea muscovyensis]
MNNNLRYAMAAARLTATDVAAALTVDPKTVARWLNGRIPYPRHRWALADLLRANEADLWPETAQRHAAFTAGVEAIYPHRWAVPPRVWAGLFQSATAEIDILAYSALFLAEDRGILNLLTTRAEAGVRIRILLGHPDSPEVANRGADEGIGPAVMAACIKNALTLYRPLINVQGIEIRLHRTVLYNSIYRADNELLVNTHAYATAAADAPVMHLRLTDAPGPADAYTASFDRVWEAGEPHQQDR